MHERSEGFRTVSNEKSSGNVKQVLGPNTDMPLGSNTDRPEILHWYTGKSCQMHPEIICIAVPEIPVRKFRTCFCGARSSNPQLAASRNTCRSGNTCRKIYLGPEIPGNIRPCGKYHGWTWTVGFPKRASCEPEMGVFALVNWR